MSATIKADGDTWKARLSREGDEPSRVLVFFCTTTDQRPWRVVEVEADRFSDPAEIDRLSGEELKELFAASRSMGAPRAYPSYE